MKSNVIFESSESKSLCKIDTFEPMSADDRVTFEIIDCLHISD